MPVSDDLSRKLRAAYHKLTIARLETLRQFVVNMLPGEIMLPGADLIDPDEVIVCLYISIDEASKDRRQAALTIRNLSAGRKRYNFPRSYADLDAEDRRQHPQGTLYPNSNRPL